MKDVLKEIRRLREERGMSEYELAKRSDMMQSSISVWYHKNHIPTFASLDKVCKGLGITLSEFFAEGEHLLTLTPEQRAFLDDWSALEEEQRRAVMELMESM
ncbi:XRE family transcriptional regulator [Butyricicoccus sp. 1XD8-22]|nr:XRE family transcriptional regulator [Butyricicoccus sp. 1XD8-22]